MARMKDLATGIRQMPEHRATGRLPQVCVPRPGTGLHAGEYVPEHPDARHAATGARRTDGTR